jgi:hypothetical protein
MLLAVVLVFELVRVIVVEPQAVGLLCCVFSFKSLTGVVAFPGSANINMRSLAGTRDTEIAACVWQPHHMSKQTPHAVHLPRGQIHGFRMSLWKEHLGAVTPEMDEVMRDPGSLECARLVQRCAKVRAHLHISICSLQCLVCGYERSACVVHEPIFLFHDAKVMHQITRAQYRATGSTADELSCVDHEPARHFARRGREERSSNVLIR